MLILVAMLDEPGLIYNLMERASDSDEQKQASLETAKARV
jgi:hypothetical protein